MLAKRVQQTEGLDFRTMKVSHFVSRGTQDKNERYQAIKVGIEKLREMKQIMEDERKQEEWELNERLKLQEQTKGPPRQGGKLSLPEVRQSRNTLKISKESYTQHQSSSALDRLNPLLIEEEEEEEIKHHAIKGVHDMHQDPTI